MFLTVEQLGYCYTKVILTLNFNLPKLKKINSKSLKVIQIFSDNLFFFVLNTFLNIIDIIRSLNNY